MRIQLSSVGRPLVKGADGTWRQPAPVIVETPWFIDMHCDHAGREDHARTPARLISRAYLDGDELPNRRWREADVGTPGALWTFFGALHRALEDRPAAERSAIMRDPSARRRVLGGRDGRPLSETWVFTCPDCTHTLRARRENADPVFEGLQLLGRREVTLAEFGEYMARQRNVR